MKPLKRLLSSIATLLGASLPSSPSVKANCAILAEQESALQRALTGVGKRRDDIGARILSRTTNQRKARNLKRWARANGSLA